MIKKIMSIWVVAVLSFTTLSSVSAYNEIKCDTDPVFKSNACSQCFDGWAKSQNSYIGFWSDVWKNTSGVKNILYKDAQTLPVMKSLAGSKVSWQKTPSSEGFWQYTDEFEKLYDKSKDAYILEPKKSVTWIKMKDTWAYYLAKNEVEKGKNIGLLVYALNVNTLLDSGEIVTDTRTHKECVLFKSGDKVVKKPKKLPETGPAEFFLLLILAMILALGVFRFRKS